MRVSIFQIAQWIAISNVQEMTDQNRIVIKIVVISAILSLLVFINISYQLCNRINGGIKSIDGGYSEWSKWGICSTTCGIGLRGKLHFFHVQKVLISWIEEFSKSAFLFVGISIIWLNKFIYGPRFCLVRPSLLI